MKALGYVTVYCDGGSQICLCLPELPYFGVNIKCLQVMKQHYSNAGKLNIIMKLYKQDYMWHILSEKSKANIFVWLKK